MSKILSFQYATMKLLTKYLYSVFHVKPLKSDIYFTLTAQHDLDTEFSQEIYI